MSLETFVKLIREGEPVRAGVVNRPLSSLDQYVRYLWDVIQAAGLGSTVYAHRQSVEEAAGVGMAVWWNAGRQRFERGLAVADGDPVSGIVAPTPQAQVWGVVAGKINDTLAEILLYGIDALNFGDTQPGTYYLSPTVPGGLTRTRPPLAVPVLRVLGNGQVFVQPLFVDTLGAGFATDQTAVLSLHGDQRIKVTCLNPPGSPGSTGHLQLTLDLGFLVDGNDAGYSVVKGFNPATSEFRLGPVCEGMYALTPNVTLSGSASRPLDPGVPAGTVLYQGTVGIAVSPDDGGELEVQLVRLSGAEEEYLQDVMYLSFAPGEDRSYRAKIHVPAGLAVHNPQLALRLVLLGRAAGTLPALNLTARRVPRADAGPLPLPAADQEFAVACDTSVTLSANNQYAEVTSTPFAVAAGDTVLFTVERLATDGYLSEVGVIRQSGVVSAGA